MEQASLTFTAQQLLAVIIIDALLGVLVLVGVGILLQRNFSRSREKDGKGGFVGKRAIDPTFARVVSLLSVATMAIVGLSLSLVVSSELITAFLTLLGTIAGYLIGAKPTTTVQTSAPDSSGDGGSTTITSDSAL